MRTAIFAGGFAAACIDYRLTAMQRAGAACQAHT